MDAVRSPGKRRLIVSYHTVIIVGHLGRDPEMRYAPSGQPVTNFSVATSRKYTASDGSNVEETSWFKVSVWGKQAESCNQYLKKGSLVVVEGRLVPDPKTGGPKIWQGQNGSGASFDINANTVRFLSTGRGVESGAYSAEEGGSGMGDSDGDVPF
jgi:single-strand DNA-binding protein